MAELKITGRRRDEIRARMEAAPPAPWRYSNWVDFPIDPDEGVRVYGEGGCAQEIGGPGVEFGHTERAVISDRGVRDFVIHARQDLEDALHDLKLVEGQRDALLREISSLQSELRLHGHKYARHLPEMVYEALNAATRTAEAIAPLPVGI